MKATEKLLVTLCIVVAGFALAHAQQCPIIDAKRYNDIKTQDKLNTAWFTSGTTPPVAQAAFAFDVPRVKCLLAAKADVNQRVRNAQTGVGGTQWALGAAVTHIDQLRKGVMDEMAETVQLLLNAGANPNIRYLVTDSSPLVEMANQVRGDVPASQNLVKVIKALVAAGADVNTTPRNALENLVLKANVGSTYCGGKDPSFNEIIDFLLARGSKVRAASILNDRDIQACPTLLAALKKASV